MLEAFDIGGRRGSRGGVVERRMRSVHVAIRTLPRREQEVLALVVWSGLDYAAAAAALGVPIGTVRSRLSRARTRLAGHLDLPALEETQ